MSVIICPECGSENPVSEDICDQCGAILEHDVAAPTPVAVEEERCPACHKTVTPTMAFCDGCGYPLKDAPPVPAADNDEDLAGNALINIAKDIDDPAQPEPPVVIVEPEPIPTPEPTPALEPEPEPLVASKPLDAPTEDMVQQWKLACVEGLRLGKEYLLYKNEMTLGRLDVEGQIFPEIELEDQDDGYVSRKHAVIRLSHDGVTIQDLGGENGTFLDGRPLPPLKAIPFGEGQVIRLGKVGLMLKKNKTRS